MAHITLAGTLLDPTSELAVGDQVRFTHKSTTGETIKSAVSLLTIPPTGDYSIDLQYGLVLVEYKDVRKSQFKNLGIATVNQDNPATSIPELLNALVPVSSSELIEFQAILADCVAAQAAAESAAALSEAFAGQLTTLEIIASSQIYAADVKLNASGFDVSGDGGGGSWIQNGVTGQTPSQSPTQLANNLLNDANGNQWALVTGQTLNYSGTQWYPLPFGGVGNGGYLFDSNGWEHISLINDLSQAYIFDTVALFKASLIEFPDGKTIHLNDRDADFTKITGTGTANTFDIIASTTVNQSIKILIEDRKVNLSQLGIVDSDEIEGFMVASLAIEGVDIIEILEGNYNYTTKPNPTIESPQRIEVRDRVGLLIRGVGNVHISTIGLTAAYINSVTDPTSSARDFVTFLSLIACTNCHVENINVSGTNDKLQKIDFFVRPREKGVGILGGIGNKVSNCSFNAMWGNGICVVNTNILYDAPFEFAVNVEICNNSASNCAENGINPLGGTQNIRIHHNDSFLNQANGIESGSDGGSISFNKVNNNFASGIGLSTKNHVTSNNEVLGNGDPTAVAVTTAGGIVVTASGGQNLISTNVIKDNQGPALWVFPNQDDVTFSNNHVEFNGKNTSNISEYVSCNNVLGSECENLAIVNNTFIGRSTTQTYGMQLNFLNNLIIKGNIFNTLNGRAITAAGDVNGVFSNNALIGAQTGSSAISNTSGPNAFLFQNNTGYTEKLVGWRSSVPTSGDYLIGDKYYKLFPAQGGRIGWVCTISGNPGTWREFGDISGT